jgi:hypothetical protein
MQVVNNGVNIKLITGTSERFIFKNQIREVSIVKTDYVKLDVGQGINNVFIKFQDVTVPITANVNALRDAIDVMCQTGMTGTELASIKTAIDLVNSNLTSLTANTEMIPLIIDEGTPNTIYRGFAVLGSAANVAVWAVEKIVQTGDVTTRTWANGAKTFVNKWSEREILNYL